MAALTADKKVVYYDGKYDSHPVAASTTIYKGALVCINASGYAVPAADTASFKFVGWAVAQADNSSGSAADIDVVVQTEGVIELAGSGFALTSVGSKVYVSDDQTVALSGVTNDVEVGKVVEYISATLAKVKINQPAPTYGGASIVRFGFFQANCTASQTDVELSAEAGGDSGRTGFFCPAAGWVVAVAAECENDLTAGTASIVPVVDGTASTTLAAALSDTVQKHQDSQTDSTADPVASGEEITCEITTDGDFAAGTTPSIWADVFVRLNV